MAPARLLAWGWMALAGIVAGGPAWAGPPDGTYSGAFACGLSLGRGTVLEYPARVDIRLGTVNVSINDDPAVDLTGRLNGSGRAILRGYVAAKPAGGAALPAVIDVSVGADRLEGRGTIGEAGGWTCSIAAVRAHPGGDAPPATAGQPGRAEIEAWIAAGVARGVADERVAAAEVARREAEARAGAEIEARTRAEARLEEATRARTALEERLAQATEKSAADLAEAARARMALEERLAQATEKSAADLAEAAGARTALEERLAQATEKSAADLAEAARTRTAIEERLAQATEKFAADLAEAARTRTAIEERLAQEIQDREAAGRREQSGQEAARAQASQPSDQPPNPAGEAVAVGGQAAAGSRIVLRAKADAWLQVRDRQGQVVLSRVLHAGESWPVPLSKSPGQLLLTTGNAGGTEVLVDGQVTAGLGDDGEVRRDLPLDADAIREGSLAPPVAVVGTSAPRR